VPIGWIGLGTMGGRIVARLLGQGESVVGWNRTRSKADWLQPLGLEVLPTPRAVAEQASIVFSMLTDAKAVQEVVRGDEGLLAGMREGSILVEMSTIDPDASRALAREVQSAGGRMLDCPVSGGVGAVAGGDLSLMVGVDETTVEAVRPTLDVIGKRVSHVGDNGQALVMKIAINLSLAVQMTAYSEGVLLAEKSGIPREKAVEALLNSAVASPMLRHRGPAVLAGQLPDPAWFNCRMMQKDLLLALELARECEVTLPTTALANQLMTAGRAMGVGEEDFSVVFHVLARLCGLRDGPA
jgi:3-hydroxyisobutyrate dehydrogenase-like beta-hydroxyacid dehydrogenase